MIYTKWYLDMLDLFFELELLLFSVFTLYVRKTNGNQSALSNTFIALSLAVFLLTVLFHLWACVTDSRLWKDMIKPWCKKWFTTKNQNTETVEEDQNVQQSAHTQKQVPVTFIELREPLLATSST